MGIHRKRKSAPHLCDRVEMIEQFFIVNGQERELIQFRQEYESAKSQGKYFELLRKYEVKQMGLTYG